VPTVLRIVTRLNRGGPLRQLQALVPGLARRGWTGPVAFGRPAAGEHDGRAALAGVDLRPVPALVRGIAPFGDLAALQALTRLAREVRPDLVHTHMGKAGLLGRIVARRLGVPAIHTLHGHHFDLGGSAARWVVRAERTLAPLTSRLVVLSPRQRRDVVEVHGVLPPERVALLGPGLDLEAVRRAGRAPRPPGCPDDGVPTFVWAGRLVPVKRPALALEAAARARVPWRLVVLGDGPLRSGLARRLDRSGLGERVLLAGEVAEPAPWIAAARALLLTSRSEGTPLAVLEAYALGRPVVVPTVGGLPDLVGHEVEGLWVAPGDADALAAALDRLASDEALAARLGAGAGRAAARFDGDLLAERTAALYDEVLGRPARADAGSGGGGPVASRG
jgi:glycogen synthase